MQLDAKRNFFSFFSGYLQLPLTAPRFHVDIPDFSGPHKTEQEPDSPPLPLKPPAEPEDLIVGRSPLPPALEPDLWDADHLAAAVRPSTPFSARLPTLPTKPLIPDPPSYSHGGGGGSPEVIAIRQPHITVDYKDGNGSLDMRLNQVNNLRDNDVGSTGYDNQLHDNDVVTEAGAPMVPWPDHAIPPISALDPMANAPNPYAGTPGTPEDIANALREKIGSSGGAGESTLREGITQDGAAVGPEAAALKGPSDLVPVRPENSQSFENPTHVAVVETGGNNAQNHGYIVDQQGAIGTMLVMGDSYNSNTIVQTNILVDHSAVAGTAPSAHVQTGGNQANNVAEFIQTLDQQNPYASGYFGGLKWNVDRVNGDYYDVNIVQQLNYMQDND